jgi:hypothetical protein
MTPAAIAVLVICAIGWIGLVKILAVEPIVLMARERRARRRVVHRRISVPFGRPSFEDTQLRHMA